MGTARRQFALVSAAEVADHAGDASWVVVDCRFNLMQPRAGHAAYREAHVPGAFYADLDVDLAGEPRAEAGGRHPLPSPSGFQRVIDAWGLRDDSRVIGYDDAGGAVAARLWWLLRWFGLPGAAVLDGGWQAWLAGGYPIATAIPSPRAGTFAGKPGQMPVIDVDTVERGLGDASLLLLDARAAERFDGISEPIDTRAGHVPGAVNAPFQSHLRTDGRFQDSAEIRRYYAELCANREMDEVACMCGSGVTACHTLLALELADRPGAALYVGSWSDWISSDRPIATA